MRIISLVEVTSFRKFTLTSGYTNTNSMFVRISDGYAVGADPLQLRDKNGGFRPHHVKYSGYLYGARKGYVFATLKAGDRGWSDIVDLGCGEYVCFNPFTGVKLNITLIGDKLFIDGNIRRGRVNYGKFHTLFGEVSLSFTPFPGKNEFLKQISVLPEWAVNNVFRHYYNSDYTRRWTQTGKVSFGTFDPLDEFPIKDVQYKHIDHDDYVVKWEDRYFVTTKGEHYFDSVKLDFLTSRGVECFYVNGSADVPINALSETTEYQWNSVNSNPVDAKAYIINVPERLLHDIEAGLLNIPSKKVNTYLMLEYVARSLNLSGPSHFMDNHMANGLKDSDREVRYAYGKILDVSENLEKSVKLLTDLLINGTDNPPMSQYYLSRRYQVATLIREAMIHGLDPADVWEGAIKLLKTYV